LVTGVQTPDKHWPAQRESLTVGWQAVPSCTFFMVALCTQDPPSQTGPVIEQLFSTPGPQRRPLRSAGLSPTDMIGTHTIMSWALSRQMPWQAVRPEI